jgi:S-adenosylmethionine uptake transporter
MALMAVLWFWGFARVPLAEAIAISFIAPLLAIYLASAFLGERVQARAAVGTLLGLAGVTVMVAARIQGNYANETLIGAAAILGAAILYAINLVLMRKQAQDRSAIEMAFYQNAATTAWLLVAAPWYASVPDLVHFPAILASAFLACAALLAISWAYARAPAQSLAIVEYTGFGWGALLGWLFFGEAIGGWVVAGATLIVLGCYFAVRNPQRPQELALEAGL